ncbi:unnamed protein product [Ectocarpus sp. 8 AP-2014]
MTGSASRLSRQRHDTRATCTRAGRGLSQMGLVVLGHSAACPPPCCRDKYLFVLVSRTRTAWEWRGGRASPGWKPAESLPQQHQAGRFVRTGLGETQQKWQERTTRIWTCWLQSREFERK